MDMALDKEWLFWGWEKTPVMSSTSQMSLVDPKKIKKKEIIVNIHLHYVFP